MKLTVDIHIKMEEAKNFSLFMKKKKCKRASFLMNWSAQHTHQS